MFNLAYAIGAQPGAEGAQGGGFAAFIPIILMFVIFYFLLIRPQQKKAKAHQEMVANLKKGDRVVTNGGIHGVITAIDESTATIEIAEKVRVKFSRGSVAALNDASGGGGEKKKEGKA
ncbi:MAG: preprotein translocase subunit YajC [Thermodesulfobacteriota bacterium]